MKLDPILGASAFSTTFSREPNGLHSDYPYTTVPNQVQRIFRAQQLHDKKHYDERMSASPEARAKMEYVDYLRPIVADADTGYASSGTTWHEAHLRCLDTVVYPL